MSEGLDIVNVLEGFLDGIYRKASQSQNISLTRNKGHYSYPGQKLCVYVTFFPKEVELVFDGEEVGAGIFCVALDICRPNGQVLAGDSVSLKGRCSEIKAALDAQEESVLTQLLKFLGD